jgi:hypothetical protein
MSNSANPPLHGARQGMIMVFVIVIMLVTSLMGLIIMVNTRSEVATSGHHRRSQAAFSSADSAAKLANLFTRVLLHPVLESPTGLLSNEGNPESALTVEFNDDRFTMEKLFDESQPYKFSERYLQTGLTNDSSALPPHIVFKIEDKVVATSVVSLDLSQATNSGFSLSALDLYDKSTGPNVPVDMVVTTRGNTASVSEDNLTDPQSLITTIMREMM